MSSPRRLDDLLADDAVEPEAANPAPAPPVTQRNRRWTAIVGAALLVLALTAVAFYQWGSAGTPQTQPTARPTPTPTKLPTIGEIYTTVAPSVVSIEAAHPGQAAGSGTGVIVNADGTDPDRPARGQGRQRRSR